MRFIAVALFTLLLVIALGAQPSPRELFERARMLEESNRNLTEAIALYGQVAGQSQERELAATAQLRLGLLHERLGHKADAQRAFRTVVSQYSDHPDVLRQAQARLAGVPISASGLEPVVRRVWPGGDFTGALSPDGKAHCFTDWSTGNLAVRELGAAQDRPLTNKVTWTESPEYAEYCVFSPDGRQIAYGWFTRDVYELRIIRTVGSQPRVVYSNPEVQYLRPFQWSPDGASILTRFSTKGRITQAALVSVVDGSARILKSFDWRSPKNMGFSADGRYITYDFPPEERSPNADVFVLSADGRHEHHVVEHPANDLFLGWVPGGRRILFATDRAGGGSAWSLSIGADGKAQAPPELVKRDLGAVWPMGFTTSGAFYYGIETGAIEVYLANLDHATAGITDPVKITERFAQSGPSADFSPDGQHIAYIAKRLPATPGSDGHLLIRIQSLATKEVKDLAPALSYVQRVRWDADERRLIVLGRDLKNRQGIFDLDVRSGLVTPLVLSEPDTSIRAAAVSADGRSLFYLQRDSAAMRARILRRDLDTGQETTIYETTTPLDLPRMALSPDLQQIAVILVNHSRQSSSLNVMSIRGDDMRLLVQVGPPDAITNGWEILAWSPDARSIFFAKDIHGGKHELWRVAVAGGEPQKMNLPLNGLWDVKAHPDGKRLAIASGPLQAEIWVMENFLPSPPAAGARR